MNKVNFNLFSSKLKGEVILPLSKSMNNRLQIIQFLQGIKTQDIEISSSRDSQLMRELLNKIENLSITKPIELNFEMAGTVFRFFTALLSTQNGNFILTGDQRLKERPIEPLVEALQQLGASITYIEKHGFLPIHIVGNVLDSKCKPIFVDASVSSQFASALLLIAPIIKNGLTLQLSDTIVSMPYITMTIEMMKEAGASVLLNQNTIFVKEGKYNNSIANYEFDWSSASFFYQLCSLLPESEILLVGLNLKSHQGDSGICNLYRKLGVESTQTKQGVIIKNNSIIETTYRVDFTSIPDIAIPVILSCAILPVNWEFTGLDNLIYKESNRIVALQTELLKMGIKLVNNNSTYKIIKPAKLNTPAPINCYNDHRIAMGFAVLATKFSSIEICEPNVVEKSFPEFWQNLTKLGFEINPQ